jgi:hypothetical protein
MLFLGRMALRNAALKTLIVPKKIDFKKPISCHLYPVRVKDYSEFKAVNYHQWNICSAACVLGESLKIPIYQFVKEALVRKFGKKWYAELEIAAQEINS